jgi:hypothetical protein
VRVRARKRNDAAMRDDKPQARRWGESVLLWLWSPFVLLPVLLIALYYFMQQEDTEPPLIDVQLHYHREAWLYYSPRAIFKTLEKFAITHIVVSSVPNEGTLELLAYDPKRVIPLLSLYQKPDDRFRWFEDPATLVHLERELGRATWRGIGEIHLSDSAQADSEIVRRVVHLAAERDLVLLVHADGPVLAQLFAHDPRVRIVWAHAGTIAPPSEVEGWLARLPQLTAELSYRVLTAPDGRLDPTWRGLLLRYPDRFMIGSGTDSNESWYRYRYTIRAIRRWLRELPAEVAERIGHENAQRVFRLGLTAQSAASPRSMARTLS